MLGIEIRPRLSLATPGKVTISNDDSTESRKSFFVLARNELRAPRANAQ
jgi:hypothetical protein